MDFRYAVFQVNFDIVSGFASCAKRLFCVVQPAACLEILSRPGGKRLVHVFTD